MTRREIFKMALGVITFGVCRESQASEPIQFIRLPRTPDSFLGDTIKIVKGSQSVTFSPEASKDCIDTHGLCATDELYQILIGQLEYGPEFICGNRKKILTLTSDEKEMIMNLIAEHRGPHICVHNGYRMAGEF